MRGLDRNGNTFGTIDKKRKGKERERKKEKNGEITLAKLSARLLH
jgi:hypothetical protein